MSLSLAQLASHAARMLKQHPRRRVLAYAWPRPWTGSDAVDVDGRTLPVHYCRSMLEIREILGREDTETPRILLVNVPGQRLGQDILARLVRRELLHVDRWQLVQDAWGVPQVDPRLHALPWLPAMLLEAGSPGTAGAAATLTLDQALATCLEHSFGMPPDGDLKHLAHACERHGPRWLALDEEPRRHFRQQLAGRLGALAGVWLDLVESGNGHAIVALGLACEVLFAPPVLHTQEARDARIRLEPQLGGHRLTEREGRQWTRVALEVSAARDRPARLADQQLATDLLARLGADDLIKHSSVLPAALDARLAALGEAIVAFLRNADALDQVEAAAAQVARHAAPPTDHPGPDAARMAVRLCRSIAPRDEPGTRDPVAAYIGEGAWQDRARRALRGVRPEPFARATSQLLDRVTELRRADDRDFAEALTRHLAVGGTPPGLVPIEDVLDQVAAPLAAHNGLLVVVLDGMSMDVDQAIGESLARRGWRSWSPDGLPLATLATVPSVTGCSRASLLAGVLTRGAAHRERQAFAAHAGLRKPGKADRPPLLFHKAGLEHGHQLAPEVAAALADARQQVVGVVINAIDDALGGTEQLRINWNLETIPLLAELLDAARQAGRVVVLTSDHGHVLERGSRLLPGGEGERHRLPGEPAAEGELLVAGPRVETLVGSALVVPWREDLRYGPKKNGYHGGISRQEMIVPLGIWSAGAAPRPEAAYQPVLAPSPPWWDERMPLSQLAVGEATSPVAGSPPRGRQKALPMDELFAPTDDRNLVDTLLASPALARQATRIGRMALEPARLSALVETLQQGGGRATLGQLARAIGIQPMRMRGVISVLERTLNMEGHTVVTLEHGTDTVLLDVALLRRQFEL